MDFFKSVLVVMIASAVMAMFSFEPKSTDSLNVFNTWAKVTVIGWTTADPLDLFADR